MKKITSLLVVLMMLVALLSLTAVAALEDINEDTCTVVKELVLQGTPTIDGKLDPIYTESMTLKLHGPADAYFISGGSCEDTTATGTVYALVDDNYVYVFYHVVDNTLIQADPEYIEIAAHPHLSDAVEVRVGDDLEDHFAPYDGSNDAHHLFYADAHGVRFTCYEESMGDDVEKMKHATVRAADGKTYYVEMAIPLQKPFKEGEIIEFEFQIDDLQDDMDSMCAVGSGYPHNLVMFTVGGKTTGYTGGGEAAEEPKEEEPKEEEPKAEEPKEEEPKVEEPKVEEPKVEEPKVEEPKVEEPKVEEPKVEEPKVEEPKVEEPKEEEPKVEEPKEEEPKEEEPKVEEPKEEEPKEEEPKEEEPKVEEPKEEEPKVEEPKEEEPKVEEPKEEEPKAEEPKVEEPKVEEPEEEKSNTGLIIGIVIAVVVVVAVVAVIATKKKK